MDHRNEIFGTQNVTLFGRSRRQLSPIETLRLGRQRKFLRPGPIREIRRAGLRGKVFFRTLKKGPKNFLVEHYLK